MKEIPQIDWNKSNRPMAEDLQELQNAIIENIDDLQENSIKKDRDNFLRNGIALQSPDGTWYKITVSNGGTLSTTAQSNADSLGEPIQISNPYVT